MYRRDESRGNAKVNLQVPTRYRAAGFSSPTGDADHGPLSWVWLWRLLSSQLKR